VNPAERLAEIVAGLNEAGLVCLVMGGHAVRFYGLVRYTNDFDLHLAPAGWDNLADRLKCMTLFSTLPPEEGTSWRPRDFRRFRIGAFADGREEWLEFWRANHLLAPFDDLFARREEGSYGGRTLPFLSLADLIASKETERDKDWDDVWVLEELHDARLFVQFTQGRAMLVDALSQLRSRRGLELFARDGQLSDTTALKEALRQTRLAITQSLLVPYARGVDFPVATIPMEPVVVSRLRSVEPGSALHFALVEIIRRQHRHARQAADREDKERVHAESRSPQ
jgi:hypothetical protein